MSTYEQLQKCRMTPSKKAKEYLLKKTWGFELK